MECIVHFCFCFLLVFQFTSLFHYYIFFFALLKALLCFVCHRFHKSIDSCPHISHHISLLLYLKPIYITFLKEVFPLSAIPSQFLDESMSFFFFDWLYGKDYPLVFLRHDQGSHWKGHKADILPSLRGTYWHFRASRVFSCIPLIKDITLWYSLPCKSWF